jgi:hypothetical protein
MLHEMIHSVIEHGSWRLRDEPLFAQPVGAEKKQGRQELDHAQQPAGRPGLQQEEALLSECDSCVSFRITLALWAIVVLKAYQGISGLFSG